MLLSGEVTERPIVQHWKCCVPEMGPGVRIPPSPHPFIAAFRTASLRMALYPIPTGFASISFEIPLFGAATCCVGFCVASASEFASPTARSKCSSVVWAMLQTDLRIMPHPFRHDLNRERFEQLQIKIKLVFIINCLGVFRID